MNLEKTNFVNWFYLDNSFSACALLLHQSVFENFTCNIYPFMYEQKCTDRKANHEFAWASINFPKVECRMMERRKQKKKMERKTNERTNKKN